LSPHQNEDFSRFLLLAVSFEGINAGDKVKPRGGVDGRSLIFLFIRRRAFIKLLPI
jgi:hypothetical protein